MEEGGDEQGGFYPSVGEAAGEQVSVGSGGGGGGEKRAE